MSKTNIEKDIVKPLLERLDKNTREDIEAQLGQLLILDDISSFKRALEATFDVKVSSKQLKAAHEIGLKRARHFHNGYINGAGKSRYKALKKKFNQISFKGKVTLGENAFLVANFSSIKLIKEDIFKALGNEVGIDSDELDGSVTSLVQRGHGEEGLAVSQVQIGTLLGLANSKRLRGILFDNLDHYIRKNVVTLSDKRKNLSVLRELNLTYNKIVDKRGDLRADYFSIITFQDREENVGKDSRLEKQLKTLLKKFIEDPKVQEKLVTGRSSPSTLDQIESQIMDSITPKSKKVRVKRKKPVKRKVTGQASASLPKNKESKARVKQIGTTKLKRGRAKTKTRQRSDNSVKDIIPFINAQLAETVEANMGSPALNYRTGRFAESVRIIRAVQTPKGYPSIEYTYQLHPYQFFEASSGSKWASIDRDPRTLIDRSIREIAQEFAIGRFYTKRL